MGTEDGAEATQGRVAGAEIANEESPLGDSVKTSGASVPCLTALLGAGADGLAGKDRPSSQSGEGVGTVRRRRARGPGATAHLGEEGLLGRDGPPRLSQEPGLPAPPSSRAGRGLQPLWDGTGTFYCKNGITDNIWDF